MFTYYSDPIPIGLTMHRSLYSLLKKGIVVIRTAIDTGDEDVNSLCIALFNE